MKLTSIATIFLSALAIGTSAPACSSASGGAAGIGAACASSADCHASSCNAGVCTKECSTDVDCPAPSQCFKSLCQFPLRVGALYSGSDSENEGWSYVASENLQAAVTHLGYAQIFAENEIYGGNTPPLVAPAVERLIAKGVDVIVATDSSEDAELEPLLGKYPQVKFITYREPGSAISSKDSPNFATYTTHVEMNWYIAGKLAVQRTHAKRLGIIGAYITPSDVQVINAFTLGARSEDPTVVVEVRWVGFWIDTNNTANFPYKGSTYFREDLIAQQLIAGGAKVIASPGDSGRPIRLIDSLSDGTVFSVSTNFQYSWRDLQTQVPFKSCLGSVYYNFSPHLEDQLAAIHRGTWAPNDFVGLLGADLSTNMTGFEPNTSSGVDDTNVQRLVLAMSGQSGIDATWRGPYESTGQLDLDGGGAYDAVQSVAVGQVLTQKQRDDMCWFVKGVVEKVDRDDTSDEASVASPSSPDVDAKVPDDKTAAAQGVLTAFGTNCKANR